MARTLIILSICLIRTFTALGGEIPRLVDLVLPEPLGDADAKLTRAQHESLGTGIGKYSYPSHSDAPICSVSYLLVDTSFGELKSSENSASREQSASSYIDGIMALESDKPNKLAVRKKIAEADCIILDFANHELVPGFWIKQYAIRFYLPDHKRVYELRFEAFWAKTSKHPYNHTNTPRIMEKAVQDFVNLYR